MMSQFQHITALIDDGCFGEVGSIASQLAKTEKLNKS